MKLPIYLDHHATTPLAQEVLDAMLPYMREHFGNASSREHAFGWRAEEAVEQARAQVAGLAGVEPREIVFTSGATEANNLAIVGVAEAYAAKGKHIITQATEHPAVLDVCRNLEVRGYDITVLPVTQEGLVTLEDFEGAIRKDTILASVMGANNEVGSIQPIQALSEAARDAGVIFHSDMAQLLGRHAVSSELSAVGLASFSAHKLYGPKGVGALFVSRRDPRVRLTPQQRGGGHERGLRSGTLNVPGIVGFGAACALASRQLDEASRRLPELRDRLIAEVRGALGEICVVHGHPTKRLPGNVSFGFEGVDGERLLLALGDLALSSGAACASEKREPSHVLRAMGVPDSLAQATLRVGLGRKNTHEEVQFAAGRIIEAVRSLQSSEG